MGKTVEQYQWRRISELGGLGATSPFSFVGRGVKRLTLREALQASCGGSIYKASAELGLNRSVVYSVLRGRLTAPKGFVDKLKPAVADAESFFNNRGMIRKPC